MQLLGDNHNLLLVIDEGLYGAIRYSYTWTTTDDILG